MNSQSRPRSAAKRKFSEISLPRFDSSQTKYFPPDAINPHSYSQSLLHQFSSAGLTDKDENPAHSVPDFPHRDPDKALRGGPRSDEDEDVDSEGEQVSGDGQSQQTKRRTGFDDLLFMVHTFLSHGAVSKAKKTFQTALEQRPHGVPVDIRHHDLWAIGAEIIMREGEDATAQEEPRAEAEYESEAAGASQAAASDDTGKVPRRWGSAANMARVREYYETLVHKYPYDHRRPHIVSAFDFWLALLGCEMYNTHTEHISALERLDAEEDAAHLEGVDVDVDEMDQDEDEETRHKRSLRERYEKLNQRRDEVRLRSLGAMRGVVDQLSNLMQMPPYSSDSQYLRLRAMATFFVGDLLTPASGEDPDQLAQAEAGRQAQHETARTFLQKILDDGGELDSACRSLLHVDNSDDEESGEEQGQEPAVYSSLPIRRSMT